MYTWWKCPFHGTSAGKRCLKMIESYKPSYWQQKCMSISWQWKNISHTKPIQLVCEVGRKTYVSLSQFPLFHILKLMDKITSIFGSYRFLRRPLTALQKICHKENCEQRTMHALSEEFDPIELRRGRASWKRQIFVLSSSDPINYEVRLLRMSEWLICISLSLQ